MTFCSFGKVIFVFDHVLTFTDYFPVVIEMVYPLSFRQGCPAGSPACVMLVAPKSQYPEYPPFFVSPAGSIVQIATERLSRIWRLKVAIYSAADL